MSTIILDNSRALRPPAVPALLLALLPLAALLVCAWLLELFVPARLDPYRIRIVMDIGIAVVMAVSLNIVNGFTGQFSIGHGGFFAVGGYVAAAITYYCSLVWWGHTDAIGGLFSSGALLFVGATICGGVCAAGAGYVVGLPSLRLRGDYLAIVTLGFGEIMRVLLELSNNQIFDADGLQEATRRELLPPPLGGAQGFLSVPDYSNLFWVYAAVAVTLVFAYRLKRSSSGRALLSIREDEIAAQAMGVNVTRYKVRAFVFAAFFAGIAGSLFAHQSGTVLRPVDAGFMRSFDVIIMVVLGGMGSISGAGLAAVLLTVMGEWLRDPTHVWYVGLYAGLIRIAFTPRAGWRDIGVIAGAAALIEILRWLCGPWVLFPVTIPHVIEIEVQLYELLYAIALLFFCVLRADVVRSVLIIVGVAFGAEIIRTLAHSYPIIKFGETEIPFKLGDYRMIVYALLLVLMMIFRPQGLFGVREIWDFLPHRRHAEKV